MDTNRRDLYTTTEDLPTANSPKHLYWEKRNKTLLTTLMSWLVKWDRIAHCWTKQTFLGQGNGKKSHLWFKNNVYFVKRGSVVQCNPNSPTPSEGLNHKDKRILYSDGSDGPVRPLLPEMEWESGSSHHIYLPGLWNASALSWHQEGTPSQGWKYKRKLHIMGCFSVYWTSWWRSIVIVL